MSDTEESLIQELVNLYNNRKRRSMDPSPASLFFLKEGPNIVRKVSSENGNVKPDYKQTFIRIKYEWTILEQYNKDIYIKGALRLGFIPKEDFSEKKREVVDKRIADMKVNLGVVSFFI